MSKLDTSPEAYAEEQGLDTVVPEGDELQLDLDDEQSLARFNYVAQVMLRNGITMQAERTASKSGNTHVYLKVLADEQSPLAHPVFGGPVMRIALQACLGSDPVREFLSLLRLTRTDVTPTVLFEKPGTVRVKMTLAQPPKRAIALGGLVSDGEFDTDNPFQ